MSEEPLVETVSRSRAIWIVIALVLLVSLVYLPTCCHPFVQWDDQVLLYENPAYNPPTWHAVGSFWTQPFRHLYQPVSFSVWAVIAWLSTTPGDPLSSQLFHVVSIEVHAATVVMVFLLFRRWKLGDVSAAIGAAGFAVHPLLADPVNWASSLYTLLASAFAVGAVYTFNAASTELNTRRRNWLVAAATLLFVAGCLSKASAVVTVWLAAASLTYRSHRHWPASLKVALSAWLVIGAAVVVVAKQVQPAVRVADLSLSDRCVVADDALAFYARKVVWPWPLTIDYGRTPMVVLGWLSSTSIAVRIEEILLLLLPAVITASAALLRRRWPELLFGWIWFTVALLPVLGLTKFEFQHISTVADRYAALAMVGPAIAMAGAARRWRWTRPIFTTVLIVWSAATVVQSTYWENTRTLMTHAEQVNPHSKVASGVLAEMLVADGRWDDADAEFRRAVANDPESATPHFDYGNFLAARGRFHESIVQYRLAIQANPNDAEIRLNLGVALVHAGDLPGAVSTFEQAAAQDPRSADAFANLGQAFALEGDSISAARAYEQALRLNPAQPQAERGQSALRAKK